MEINIEKYKNEIIRELQHVVQIKTVLDTPVDKGPFGKGNKECLEYVLSLCQRLGFKVKNLDGYCGYAEVGEGDELVGIIGHLDVVPEGDGWLYPPYSGEIVNNEIYGRGTIDDKGPVIISIYAIKALMDSGFKFNKRVRLIFGCNEESGSLCMEHYLKVDEPISYGVSPDASFPVIFAEKTINNISINGTVFNSGNIKLIYLDAGIVINAVPDKCSFKLECLCPKCQEKAMNEINSFFENNHLKFEFIKNNNELLYTVYGKAAHGSTPHLGLNAGSYAILALNGIVENKFIDFYNKCIGIEVNGQKLGCYAEDEYGPIAVNVGMIHYENDTFEIKINSRLPFNITTKIMLQKIEETIKPYEVSLTLLSTSNGFKIDPNSTMIKTLVQSYQDVTKDYQSQPICCAGGTYAREFKNCVAFGPEMEGYGEMIIHQPNERITFEAIEAIFKIYFQAYKNLITKVTFK